MFDFLNDKPLECPDERYIVKARYTGSVIGIRDMMNEILKIPPLNAMETAVALDVSESVSMRYEGREYIRIAALVRLGCLIERERQRRATQTDSDEPGDASALTDSPAADTTLKAVNEKLDAVLDALNLVTGKTNPDAAFAMRTFADGSGRFLPVDTPVDTSKDEAAADTDAPNKPEQEQTATETVKPYVHRYFICEGESPDMESFIVCFADGTEEMHRVLDASRKANPDTPFYFIDNGEEQNPDLPV